MTVSAETPIALSVANGVTTVFPYSFTVLDEPDLVVKGSLAGVVTTYTYGVDYLLSGVGTSSGSVNFTVAPANGTIITRYRASVIERETDYQDNGDLPADTLNLDLDRLWLVLQELLYGTRGSPSALRVPEGETIPALPARALRANTVPAFDANGDPTVSVPASGSAADVLLQLASTASASLGGNLVGLYDPDDLFAATSINAAIQELGLFKKKLVDVSAYPWLADMTGVTDSTMAVRAAEIYASSIGAGLYAPAGTLAASISPRRNNFTLRGAGKQVTTIKLPATTFAITSVSRAGTGVVTVQCSSTAALWADLSIKLSGVTDATFNQGYSIVAITNSTTFTCQREGGSTVVASSSGGVVSYANAIDAGQCPMGNLATAYTGLSIRDITIDGNKSNRASVSGDLTDWGLPITAWSDLDIDVRAKNCHNGGVGAFINSNRGHIRAYVESCGNATYTGPGFDLNSSKELIVDVVSNSCYDGSRVLDNCYGVIGRFSNLSATRHGFIHLNQAVNSSYANHLTVSVRTCGGNGVIIGTGVRDATLDLSVHGATGIGVSIADAVSAVNRVNNCIIRATTMNCGEQGMISYADDCQITHNSRDDGRTGAAGTNYSTDIYGNESLYAITIKNTGVANARGAVVRSGATDNNIIDLREVNVVSNISDSGTRTMLRGWLLGSATYDPPSLADGAGVTTTVTVTGAAIGDFAVASFGQDIQGITLTAYVSAANTVSVRFQNESGGVLDLGSLTLRARVMKAAI